MVLKLHEHYGGVHTKESPTITKESAWLNKDIKSAMRKRNTIFEKTGYSAKFRSACNRVIGMLRRAKANYFKNLNPRDSKNDSLPLNMAKKYVLCSLTIENLLTVSPTCLC